EQMFPWAIVAQCVVVVYSWAAIDRVLLLVGVCGFLFVFFFLIFLCCVYLSLCCFLILSRSLDMGTPQNDDGGKIIPCSYANAHSWRVSAMSRVWKSAVDRY